ncbi:hypothetical protein Zmor_003639 [Zophobas morio]|uniref:THAP-type domain-containing protein n=1 Tax=Zophobas morio TaxID=2755281 RepID=A0AA38HPH2_9CUCU|nr:hypothetical protein Zmor_003639 [Zophobas morio]
MQELWRQICKIDASKPCKSLYLCQNHFHSRDFHDPLNRNRRLPNVVPKEYVFKEAMSSASSGCSGNLHSVAVEPVASCSFSAETDFSTVEESNVCLEEIPSELLCSSTATCTTASDKPGYAFLSESFPESKTRPGILSKIGVHKKDLTPRKELLYNVHRTAQSRITKLKEQLAKERDQVKKLRKLYESKQLEVIDTELNTINKTFINCQLQNHLKVSSGKRYTKEMKLFALTMYKRSPRLYKYMQVHFELPSPRVLKRVLNGVVFDIGFNNNLLQCLKVEVSRMHELDRYCTLMFDEIKLSSILHYEKYRQIIMGYEDLGYLGRFNKNADHALVFMARGVRKRWKQPIAYFFTWKTIKTPHLKQIVVRCVQELRSIGLNVVTTVCDQGATNRGAMSQLCRETVNDTPSMTHFVVDDVAVNTMYDLGHLMKSTRNALLDNEIRFEDHKSAKFEHIVTVFELDQKNTYKILPKLKPEHFNFKNSYLKMKVNVACRQLSASVAAAINVCTSLSVSLLPTEAIHTADFIHFTDQLFDSLNGSQQYASDGKPLRCAITADSPHLAFWNESLSKISKWKIISLKTGKDVTHQFSFINGWQVSIRSAIAVWNNLHLAGFQYLCPRVLNQDPVENLFCCIRQHGVTNTNPTCHQFVAALKACIVNNLVTPKYVSANCEDDGESVLSNLHALLEGSRSEDDVSNFSDVSDYDNTFKFAISNEEISEKERAALKYVSGLILKKINLPDCASCKSFFFSSSDQRNPSDLLIIFKENDNQERLTYSSDNFAGVVHDTHQLLTAFLQSHSDETHLEDKFKTHWLAKYGENVFPCGDHRTDVCRQFLNFVTSFFIFKYVNDINRSSQEAFVAASVKHVNKMKTFRN